MKAQMNKSGSIVIHSEDKSEAYALRKWALVHGRKLEGEIVFSGIAVDAFFPIAPFQYPVPKKQDEAIIEITKEQLLKQLDELECKMHRDSHPQLHKLIVDYLFEHYQVIKCSAAEKIGAIE
jgi:hypothetical protein